MRIEQGSIVTIMGSQRIGKSTLGRIMAGILIPRSGAVGHSPDFMRSADVVYVDQHPLNSVFPWQTVLDNVRYPLEKPNWEGSERRDHICYLMNLFRLSALTNVYPAQLSGGELQRLRTLPLPLLEAEAGDSRRAVFSTGWQSQSRDHLCLA